MSMSIGHECTTGGSQQRQLVKKLTSLSLSLYIYINVPSGSFLYMINNAICSLSLSLSPFLYLFLSVHNSKFSAICANSSFSNGTSKTTLSVVLSPFSLSLSLYLEPLLALLSHCKSLSLSVGQ